MEWKEKAIAILKDSLHPVPTELNELDWKSGLSDKTERLAQHISAFANMKGGGILVYGVNNDGCCFDLNKDEYEDGKDINNQSVRERFELGKNDSSVASRIISDTVEKGLIKPANSDTTSKKYMTYVPYYA